MATVANAVAGTGGLLAWRVPAWRGRWLWVLTGLAELAILVQVATGVMLVANDRFTVHRLHQFYGFVGFLAVGIAYSSRESMRGRQEMFYGLVGLFLMGVAIRAWTQVA